MAEKILIVEDERNLRRLYQMELEQDGYEVTTAADGQSALRRLADGPVDLVLLDLALPDGSGLDYLQQFMEMHRHVKVVINTAYPLYKRDFHCWAADAFLIKTSDLTELKSTIDHFLHEPQYELQKG
ncbi:response regulator [candidate division KSB1 bacterium]|nr:MAG: response regulator [candidate division KSB1 bacterium]MBC6948243.1 response regulator [candidate division KSB1 bacterium]MCE7941939.1 response regulator [Chlorobi bacterium CHB1]MDL1876158.1 response regulator [Cytophagia bacterium CHB2]